MVISCWKKAHEFGAMTESLLKASQRPANIVQDGKLVDNFSHESDFTSLQDPFMSRPQKNPFLFF